VSDSGAAGGSSRSVTVAPTGAVPAPAGAAPLALVPLPSRVGTVSGPGYVLTAGTVVRGEGGAAASAVAADLAALLRPVTGVVVVLGFVYTVKVIDIILVLTGGGPANGSLTLAVQSYKLSFQNFAFGQGAAMSNVLIVVALIFAVIYLRMNKQAFTSS